MKNLKTIFFIFAQQLMIGTILIKASICNQISLDQFIAHYSKVHSKWLPIQLKKSYSGYTVVLSNGKDLRALNCDTLVTPEELELIPPSKQ